MKRSRFAGTAECDDEADDARVRTFDTAPLTRYAAVACCGTGDDFLREMGLASSTSCSPSSSSSRSNSARASPSLSNTGAPSSQEDRLAGSAAPTCLPEAAIDKNHVRSKQDDDEKQKQHDDGETAGHVQVIENDDTAVAALLPMHSHFHLDDVDVPHSWVNALGSCTTLVNTLFIPLTYLMYGKEIDDTLLAQYMPYKPERTRGSDGRGDGDGHGFVHPYGIEPGWRWDGVVRGRVDS